MPMLCPVCGHHEDTKEDHCPKCGTGMRFSVLAGLKFEGSPEGTIKIGGEDAPSWSHRAQQFLLGVVWSNVLVVGLAFLVMIVVIVSGMEPEELPNRYPILFQFITGGVIVLAVMCAVMSQLRGVYLAQTVGACIGVVGSAITCAGRLYLGLPMSIWEWSVVPISGLAAFAVGLKVGGTLEKVEEFEFKPIDSWDRKAKPSEKEINPPLMRRWNRLIIGTIFGVIAYYSLPSLVAGMLRPLLRTTTVLDVAMARVEPLFQLLAWFCAGMIAGSGTQRGFIQGVLAGVFVFFICESLTPSEEPEFMIARGISAILATTVGGICGRQVFRPYRIFGNARGVRSAPMVQKPAIAK